MTLAKTIGKRLRNLREQNNLTQAQLQNRSALPSAYISSVENGHLVPELESLEKFARGLGIPLYQLFIGANQRAKFPRKYRNSMQQRLWGSAGDEARMLAQFRRHLGAMSERSRQLLIRVAATMSKLSG